MVFPDRTLIELALKKPSDIAALDAVHGIGQAKRERWGEDFLAVIQEFAATAMGMPENPPRKLFHGRPR